MRFQIQRIHRHSLLVLSLVLFGCLLAMWLPNHLLERRRLAAELTEGFEQAVKPASSSFVENVHSNYGHLLMTLGQTKASFRDALRLKVEKEDGYTRRAMLNDQELKMEFVTSINMNFCWPLNRAIHDFQRSYSNEASSLCNKLLLREVDGLTVPEFRIPEQIVEEAAAATGRGVQSGSSANLKAVEDAATFVPILGDAWDIYRSFVNDPRLENLQAKAEATAERMFSLIESKLKEQVGKKLPSEQQVESNCRRSANPNMMLSVWKELNREPL